MKDSDRKYIWKRNLIKRGQTIEKFFNIERVKCVNKIFLIIHKFVNMVNENNRNKNFNSPLSTNLMCTFSTLLSPF